jgi:hypothetical protein
MDESLPAEEIAEVKTIIEIIESAGCQYLIKEKEYPMLASQVTAPTISFMKSEEGRETTELFMKLDAWDKDRRFVVSRVLPVLADQARETGKRQGTIIFLGR